MRLLLITVLWGSLLTSSMGQNLTDTISVNKTFGGLRFSQGLHTLTMKQLTATLKTNEAAYQVFKPAKASNVFAGVVAGVGGFMIGWPLGSAIAGGKPNWTLAAIGGGLVLVTIPLSSGFNKKAKKAVDIYNEGLRSTTTSREVKMSISGNGLGVIWSW